MMKQSPSKYSLFLGGLAASTPSAFGAVTISDNGGAGWSFTGEFPVANTLEIVFTGTDFPGVFPAGYRPFNIAVATFGGDPELVGDENLKVDFAGLTGTLENTNTKTKVATELGVVDEQILYHGMNSDKSGTLVQSIDPEPSFDGLLGLSLLEEAGLREDTVERLYGWMELEASITGNRYEINVSRIGLEDQLNTPILTPRAIPEAGSTALLLMGAAGLGARRRRKAS